MGVKKAIAFRKAISKASNFTVRGVYPGFTKESFLRAVEIRYHDSPTRPVGTVLERWVELAGLWSEKGIPGGKWQAGPGEAIIIQSKKRNPDGEVEDRRKKKGAVPKTRSKRKAK